MHSSCLPISGTTESSRARAPHLGARDRCRVGQADRDHDTHGDDGSAACAKREPSAVVARRLTGSRVRRAGTTAKREHVGGSEGGSVGRGVGTGPGDRRRARSCDGEAHEDRDRKDAEHQHGSRAPFVVHFSTRMTTRDWSVGSGNSGPTSGRSVWDV